MRLTRRAAATMLALTIGGACKKEEGSTARVVQPTAAIVYVVITPTPVVPDAASALAAAMTALPQPSPTAVLQSAEQTFALTQPTAPAAPVANDRVEPTPPSIHEELERCVVYSAVADDHYFPSLLPEQVGLHVTAKNVCDLPFTTDETWFEVTAVDRAGHVVARKTGRFIVPFAAHGTAESLVILYPMEQRLQLQVSYQVKPWWAAGGGRRVGE